MEYNELIADFAARHDIANLVSVDRAASLDIDGIIVTLVDNDGTLVMSAEIGEPPSDGGAAFADILLEANLQSGAYFAKAPENGPYLVVRRMSLAETDGAAFDSALESFVNTAEMWRRMLADFRPAVQAAMQAKAEEPEFGEKGFLHV